MIFIIFLIISFCSGACFGTIFMLFEHIKIIRKDGEILMENRSAAYDKGFREGMKVQYDRIEELDNKLTEIENKLCES